MQRSLGPYSLVEEIGRGGVGVVYRARSPEGRDVALKVLLHRDADRLARFERERRLLEALSESDGFVPLLAAGQENGVPYLVMPFVAGGNLRRLLEQGPLGVDETRRLGHALARALGRAHERGIVHRDLKPENVLLASPKEPLVADLGLAKHFRSDAPGASQSVALSRSGALVGTVGYMAPEQVANPGGVGATADVFALGVILYECLAGRPAFHAENVVEALTAIGRCQPEPLVTLRADAPSWLVAVVERCLAREPGARFADGAALARALEKAPAPGPSRGARRSARVAVAALVLAAAGVGGAALLLERGRVARLDEAASRARQALEHVERGEAQLLRGQRREALVSFGRAVELDPSSGRAWRARGAALRAAGQLQAAVADLDRALALDARDARALCERGRARNELHDFERALADANRALELDDRLADALACRGEARMRTKDAGGLADIERAIARSPRTAWFYDARARLAGTIAEQLADTTRALELDPSVPSFWCDRAGNRINSGDLDGAIADASRAIELDPACAWGYGRRGDALLLKGDLAGARRDFDRAIALLPTEYWFRNYRAGVRLQLGDYAGAIADEDEAFRLDPHCYGTVYVTRGVAYLKSGDRARGIADIERAIASDVDERTKAQMRRLLADLEAGGTLQDR